MKKIFLTVVLLTIAFTSFAQAPQAFKYQTVVRDNIGEVIANQNVSFRISIRNIYTTGLVLYQESHTVMTNQFGLANIEIGNGTPPITGTFSSIDWGENSKFLEIELDTAGGTSYISMGVSQLLSVPYALHSETSEDSFWDITGSNIFYNNGNVGIGLVDPLARLHIKKSNEIVRVESETLDNWISIHNTNGYIGYLGTYSGEYDIDIGTGSPNDFGKLQLVTKAIPRLTIDENGNVGIGMTNPGVKLEVNGQVKFTGGNPGYGKILISDATGLASWHNPVINDLSDARADTTSVFLGSGAGENDDGNNSNSALGTNALHHNIDRTNLVAIGDSALYNNGIIANEPWEAIANTAIGSKSLFSNTNGSKNTANGYQALYSNTSGNGNTAFGNQALYNNTTGLFNAAYGNQALSNNLTGYGNTAIGLGAGPILSNLNYTGALGHYALPTTDGDIRLGANAVDWIGGNSAWYNVSDGRFKINIQENVPGLDFILKLRPVTYQWDIHNLNNHMGISDSAYQEEIPRGLLAKKEAIIYTGLIAQEVEAAAKKTDFDFSGVHISENEYDPYSLAYGDFVMPLIIAIQEQQKMIEELQKKIERLEDK